MKRLILIVLVIGMSLLWACAAPPATPPAPPPKEPAPKVIELTAEQLYSAYKVSQVTADGAYKGEILRVTGVVESMGKDAAGTAYVMLSSGGTNKAPGVKCMFSRGYGGEMVGVTDGDTITVQGICFGYFENVIITECILVR